MSRVGRSRGCPVSVVAMTEDFCRSFCRSRLERMGIEVGVVVVVGVGVGVGVGRGGGEGGEGGGGGGDVVKLVGAVVVAAVANCPHHQVLIEE